MHYVGKVSRKTERRIFRVLEQFAEIIFLIMAS